MIIDILSLSQKRMSGQLVDLFNPFSSVQDLPDVSEYPAVADISTIPLWFGAAVLAFEGIGIVRILEV